MNKKNSSILFILIFLLSACRYVQVVTLESHNTKLERYLIYENDTLKVAYDLWAHHGILSFSIYNKLNKPLYIDWKKCSFILNNSKKLDYYVDMEKSDQISYYNGYLWYNYWGRPNTSSVSAGRQTTIKSERVTFIPPKASIGSSKFKLTKGYYILVNPKVEMVEKTWKPKSKKLTKIKKLEFADSQTSPEFFRNFLTFSTSEKFETEFYVENSFWVKEIVDMKRRQFLGAERTGSVFRSPNKFYNYLDNKPDPYVTK
jgi:hypothetical protein